MFHKIKIVVVCLFLLVLYCIPLKIALQTIVVGTFPFWSDPARDLVLAAQNLHKLSLIGPTSGISGLFYGPYWIWWLSIPMFFNKNPRFIDFFCLTLPYFTLFPLILYKFSKIWGKIPSIVIWILFMVTYKQYTFFIWNPHLAPLILLVVIYLLVTINYKNSRKLSFLSLGILMGLLINIDIALSIGILPGVVAFIIGNLLFAWNSDRKQGFSSYLMKIVSLILGMFILFIPFMIFELRHAFLQTHTILTFFTSKSRVVEHGFSQSLILNFFIGKLPESLSLPWGIVIILLIMLGIYILFSIFIKRSRYTLIEYKLLLAPLTLGISVLLVYLTAKNAIWNYHFIGVEIFFFILLGFFLKKVPVIRYIALAWGLFLLFQSTSLFLSSYHNNPEKFTSLLTEEQVLHTIYQDTGSSQFGVYVNRPEIFGSSYEYLFEYIGNANLIHNKPSEMNHIYLILPTGLDMSVQVQDFVIHHLIGYNKTKEWTLLDQQVVIRGDRK